MRDMREYIRTKNIKEGDILAKTLYDDKMRIILREGNKVTKRLMNIISSLGYKGIYIDNTAEQRREDIPIAEPLVDDMITFHIIGLLSELIKRADTMSDINDSVFANYRKLIEEQIEEIVDKMTELERQQELLYETEDNRIKSKWIQYHSLNTCLIATGIAIKLGLNKQQVYNVAVGAMYHDIGKILLDLGLINKENLTDSERAEIRKHPEKAFRILQRLNYPVETTYAVWFHHEHCDGTGYPNGVTAEKIPLSAKIVALASAYDNMINFNPYNDKPMYQIDALNMLSADCRFDTSCVNALLHFVTPYPVGSKVELSNGKEALVLKNVPGLMERPYIIIGKEMISLSRDQRFMSVTITKLIEQ